MEKICTSCKEKKQLRQFYKDAAYKDGFKDICMKCYMADEKARKSKIKKPLKNKKVNTKIDKTPNWLHLDFAKQLASILMLTKNINITESKITNWSKDIEKLHKMDGVSFERIKKALDWYEFHIEDAYVPIIESGHSLRNKFLNLEASIRRCTTTSNTTKDSSLSILLSKKEKEINELHNHISDLEHKLGKRQVKLAKYLNMVIEMKKY